MTPRAVALLDDLRARGFNLLVIGDRVRIEFDADALPPTVIEDVRALKPELVQALRLEGQLLQRVALVRGLENTERPRALPPGTLHAVSMIMARFGGEIVAVTREEAPLSRVDTRSPRVCRACGGTSFWISHAGVATCIRCHPPAGSRLVRVWLDDGVETPAGDAEDEP